MSWHRDSRGLWCACFLAYQPDDGHGCPAHNCPEVPLPKGWNGVRRAARPGRAARPQMPQPVTAHPEWDAACAQLELMVTNIEQRRR